MAPPEPHELFVQSLNMDYFYDELTMVVWIMTVNCQEKRWH